MSDETADEPCETCIIRNLHAAPHVRSATFGSWDNALRYCGTDFLCHETRVLADAASHTVCAGFERYKRAVARNPNFKPKSVEHLLAQD